MTFIYSTIAKRWLSKINYESLECIRRFDIYYIRVLNCDTDSFYVY